MTPDDELLRKVHLEARRRIRHRRAMASAAAIVVVVGASAAALAATRPDQPAHVITTGTAPASTASTTAAPTTAPSTSMAPPTSSSTTTSVSSTVPTTVEDASTTVFEGASGELHVTVTVHQRRSRPGHVELDIQIRDPHGSMPMGSVTWSEGTLGEPFGDHPEWIGTECDPLVDDDPTTNVAPDPTAAPIDRTFRASHDYPANQAEARASISIFTSFCTTDAQASVLDGRIDLRP